MTDNEQPILCVECSAPAVMGVKEVNAGLCQKHMNEALAFAIIQKVNEKAVKENKNP